MRWLAVAGVLTLLAAIAVACGVGTPAPSGTLVPDRTGAANGTPSDPTSVPAVTSAPMPLATVAPAVVVTPAPESTPTPVPTQAPAATPTPTPTLTPPPTSTPLPPLASFSIDVDFGPAPLTVEFENTSRGPKITLEWDFGDGNTSAEPFPVHRYTASGSYTVQLRISALSGNDISVKPGLITVLPGPPVDLQISPFNAILAVEEDVQFTAIARDEFGNVVPVPVVWSTSGEGGVMGDDGLFTAGTTADTFRGVVEASLKADSAVAEKLVASASVTVMAGPLSRVVLQPDVIVMDIGASQPFAFKAVDKFGNQISNVVSSWSVTPEVGEISPTGVLSVTGTNAGSYLDAVKLELVGGANKASASAVVAIRPDSLASIKVQPSVAVMRREGTVQLSATGYDSYGNVIPRLEFVWEADLGIVIDRTGKVSTASSTLPSGLISSWAGDGNAIDSVNGNHGVLRGGPVYTTGVLGQAFNFDGEDDYLEVPVSNFLNITGDVTVHLWAKRTGFSGRDSSVMIQKGAGMINSKDAPSVFGLQFSESNRLSAFYEGADGESYYLRGPTVTDSEFHHYAYVRTGELNELLMDGELVAKYKFTADPGDTVYLPLTIGAARSDRRRSCNCRRPCPKQSKNTPSNPRLTAPGFGRWRPHY